MTIDLHHLAAAYSLDALTPDERREFEEHYPSCAICMTEVDEYRETASRLAEAAATAPPADLKAKVMAQVATTRQIPPIVPTGVVDLAERRVARRTLFLTSIAAALIAVVGVFSAMQLLRGPSEVEQLLALPDTIISSLDGEVGMVRVVWSPSSDQVAVIATDVPEPGPGMVYELWFLLEDGVAPAGLFTPEAGAISRLVDVEDRTPVGWGITIEPEGGSDQPTGAIVYSGTL